MTPANELHAQIGQVKIGRPGEYLHALLGSCIGIGVLHPDEEVYGLAHCLLSKSPDPIKKIGARHIDQAVYSLMKLMDIHEENRRRVNVFIAGGGNMTRAPDATSDKLVGCVNFQFAKKLLREKRLRLIHEEVGGCNARKVIIDCSTGEFEINNIPRLGVAS
ncbi:MAG: chemotaxis protein CheD [Henriciella sp.]|nr:chemotaxis protein CheD [Henriciella sp.]